MSDAPSNVTTQPSLTTRISQWWGSIPLYTKTLFIFCIAVFLFQTITTFPATTQICYNYGAITQWYQIYRLWTHQYFHASILHIIFNMFAVMSLGIMLEKKIGTVSMISTTLVMATVLPLINMAITFITLQSLKLYNNPAESLPSFVLNFITQMAGECGVGFSGVLFAYMVISIHYDGANPMASFFGLFSFPAFIYPWILLFITTLLMPGVSFMGHLCGILGGYLFAFVILKRSWWVRSMQFIDRKLPTRLTQLSSFVLTDGSSVMILPTTTQQNNGPFSGAGRTLGSASSSAQGAITGIWDRVRNGLSDAWDKAKDAFSSAKQRLSAFWSAPTMSSQQRSNRRNQYDTLQEEDESIIEAEDNTVPPSNQVAASGAGNQGTLVELDEQRPTPSQPSRANPTSPPPPSQSSAATSDYFSKLSGGRTLGGA